jgi:hypothetical protein
VIAAAPLPQASIGELPAAGQTLSGPVQGRLRLRAEDGPFTVAGDVTVPPGAGLVLEPGVALRFQPDALLEVAGGTLLAYGSADAPVTLEPRDPNARSGAFQGLVLDRADQAVLRHVAISRAATGLRIRNCGPELTAVRITGSSQAGLLLQDGARPQVSCCRIQGNRGMGGLIMEGAGLAPHFRDNVFLDNRPFHVQSFTPLQVDLSGNWWGASPPRPRRFLGDVIVAPALAGPPGDCAPSP